MERIDLKEKASFSEQFAPLILKASPGYKIPLICMKPGQEIPAHPGGTGVFYIVSGKGVMTVDGRAHEVQAGNLVLVDEGESRGIRATETLMAFAVHIK